MKVGTRLNRSVAEKKEILQIKIENHKIVNYSLEDLHGINLVDPVVFH